MPNALVTSGCGCCRQVRAYLVYRSQGNIRQGWGTHAARLALSGLQVLHHLSGDACQARLLGC